MAEFCGDLNLNQESGEIGTFLQNWDTLQQPLQDRVDDELLSLHQALSEVAPMQTEFKLCTDIDLTYFKEGTIIMILWNIHCHHASPV